MSITHLCFVGGHSFCKNCVEGFKSNNKVCPTCKLKFTIKTKHPQNFKLNGIKELFYKTSLQRCKHHPLFPANIICITCESENTASARENICYQCFETDHKNHQVTFSSNSQKIPALINKRKDSPDIYTVSDDEPDDIRKDDWAISEFNEYYCVLMEYIVDYGNCNVPLDYRSNSNNGTSSVNRKSGGLGNWISAILRVYDRSLVDPEVSATSSSNTNGSSSGSAACKNPSLSPRQKKLLVDLHLRGHLPPAETAEEAATEAEAGAGAGRKKRHFDYPVCRELVHSLQFGASVSSQVTRGDYVLYLYVSRGDGVRYMSVGLVLDIFRHQTMAQWGHLLSLGGGDSDSPDGAVPSPPPPPSCTPLLGGMIRIAPMMRGTQKHTSTISSAQHDGGTQLAEDKLFLADYANAQDIPLFSVVTNKMLVTHEGKALNM